MNQDFRDLLAEFNARQVEFLLVGAHALAAHGHVRATQDLDVWVRPSPENATRVIEALRVFGAPLHDLTEKDLTTPGLVFQIGVEPIRIDVLTVIDGVQFDEAWAERMISKFADQPVAVLSKEHLIKNKLASARTQMHLPVAFRGARRLQDFSTAAFVPIVHITMSDACNTLYALPSATSWPSWREGKDRDQTKF